MIYLGGTYPSVRGHPPHRARQYCLPASTSASRASSTRRLAPHKTTTRGGSASPMIRRNTFPFRQVFQYGFATTRTPFPALPDAEIIGCRNNVRGKTFSRHGHGAVDTRGYVVGRFAVVKEAFRIQSGASASPADGPETGKAPSAPAYSGPTNHRRKTGASNPGSLCMPQVFGRAPFQGAGNLVRLTSRLDAATSGGLNKPVLRRNPHPPLKAHADNLAHSLVSKSAEPVRPVSVSLQ